MIVRIWHGRTPRGVADEYAAFLERRALADYRAVPGDLAAAVYRRDERDVCRAARRRPASAYQPTP